MKLRALTLPLALATSAACAAAANPNVDLAAEEAAIRARGQELLAAEAGRETERSAAFYLEDAVLQPPNGQPAQGREAIGEFYSGMATLDYADLSSTPTRISVAASGDLAYEYGVNRMTFDTPEGSWTDVGKYLVVWKKQDGEWYVAALSFSSDAPPRSESSAPEA